MSLVQQPLWEIRLMSWAQEAFDTQTHTSRITGDSNILNLAYKHCTEITKLHSQTFYIASGLLPEEKRKAVRALYAFCRITDDIVDTNQNDPQQKLLKEWQQDVMSDRPNPHSPVSVAWADTQKRFDIPHGYARQLIKGVASDLEKTRYATFDELAEYAYGVASTVGLMAMHIIGFESQDAISYAVRLGVALQMTNILRDIGEDWQNGRLYLPQEELDLFGINEADIDNRTITDQWRKFMQFQIDRNRKLYEESRYGISLLNSDGRFAITAAADLYEAILHDIENNDYNVFHRRAHVGKVGKLSRLPKIWWRSRFVS